MSHRLECFGILLLTWVAASGEEVTPRTSELVGRQENGHLVTPVNQVVTPTGDQLDLPGMRPQVLALSPGGTVLVTAGKTNDLVVIDPEKRTVLARVGLPGESVKAVAEPLATSEFDAKGQISYTGLIFSPDGKRLYLSNVNGSVKVLGVEGTKVSPLYSISLPEATAPNRKQEIPAGLALSPDGKLLYVALNLSNKVAEIESASGHVVRQWDVGVAPYGVERVGSKLYVSNWGGRRPDSNSLTGPAGQGTLVRVDPVRHIAYEGSVSVISLDEDKETKEIMVGLHSSALTVSPDAKHVIVANAGSDTLSVIDTRSDEVVRTIWTKENPSIVFGASPNALCFDPTGKFLYVCNGTMNSVAVIEFDEKESEWEGQIPVGWFPGAIVFDKQRNRMVVANIKGLGGGRISEKTGKPEFNSHQYHGSLSFVGVPSKDQLKPLSQQVDINCRLPLVVASMRKPRENQTPVPVPERVGEPSLFEHVVYIIKENRTYDQVFGDIPGANGEPKLCIFGDNVTPNQHKMVKDFVLLDNTYCSGILSADGHQWADTAFATDYMEKSFASFPRSYPDGMSDEDVDALAYAPSGFIWDNALAKGKSLRVYGEFAITEASWKDKAKTRKPKFVNYYRDFIDKTNLIDISSRPAIESLRPHLCAKTVGWDMDIPDVFRAAKFIEELREYEKQGTFPNLVIICLPNDHTSGTSPGSPTPAAQVADNDLAFGQIVDAISKSPFWKKTCIFAIEDDPQAGWDHVSGYRTTAYVVSPYTKRGAVVSTQYNQTSILRTMELILGLPPMNIMDASATPMSDCFTSEPDFTPYDVVPNNVPLDQMNPLISEITNPLMKEYAEVSSRLPLEKIDQCPEDLLNRILWHAQKGPNEPYPAYAIHHTDDDD